MAEIPTIYNIVSPPNFVCFPLNYVVLSNDSILILSPSLSNFWETQAECVPYMNTTSFISHNISTTT